MQGIVGLTQDGVRIWRMPPYIRLIWETVTLCSEFSMATGVRELLFKATRSVNMWLTNSYIS